MNAIAAISEALLRGEILTIKTAFKDFGVTNLPREISRGVEKKFGVTVSKLRREGKTRYKIRCSWYEYRLNPSIEGNEDGIKKMSEYVYQNGGLAPKEFYKEIKKKLNSQNTTERLF